MKGKDAWGHTIVYECITDEVAIIRSVGPNGRDECGKGDDIQRIIIAK